MNKIKLKILKKLKIYINLINLRINITKIYKYK